jgi:hypothetical protein
VFDQTCSIFVHIPKCAGISVSDTLYKSHAGGHYPLDSYVDAFEPQKLLEYFKFTIVRNPWDRLVSAYHFLCNGGMNHGDADFYEKELKNYLDFDDFVKQWLNTENISKGVHFRPQTDFILERHRKVELDFIGYFENLDEDFEFIARKIGCADKLASKNKSSHKAYTDYYSDETRELVAEVYRNDIEYLGYDFFNANLDVHLAIRDRKQINDA